MYALVAAVVIATPAAYVTITTVTVDRLGCQRQREHRGTADGQAARNDRPSSDPIRQQTDAGPHHECSDRLQAEQPTEL